MPNDPQHPGGAVATGGAAPGNAVGGVARGVGAPDLTRTVDDHDPAIEAHHAAKAAREAEAPTPSSEAAGRHLASVDAVRLALGTRIVATTVKPGPLTEAPRAALLALVGPWFAATDLSDGGWLLYVPAAIGFPALVALSARGSKRAATIRGFNVDPPSTFADSWSRDGWFFPLLLVMIFVGADSRRLWIGVPFAAAALLIGYLAALRRRRGLERPSRRRVPRWSRPRVSPCYLDDGRLRVAAVLSRIAWARPDVLSDLTGLSIDELAAATRPLGVAGFARQQDEQHERGPKLMLTEQGRTAFCRHVAALERAASTAR